MNITRREFIKDASLVIGGASLGTIALGGACSPGETNPATSTPGTTVPTTPETTSNQTPSNSATSQTPTATGAFQYVPSREGLVFKLVPGCTSFAAMDRLYTADHIWVKKVTEDKVVLGITDKMQLLMERITELSLPQEGQTITRGDTFGFAEGDKMSADLIAPVSGKVYQLNNDLWSGGGENKGFDIVTGDPYVNGWMVVVELTKPAEIKELITPETYMELNRKA